MCNRMAVESLVSSNHLLRIHLAWDHHLASALIMISAFILACHCVEPYFRDDSTLGFIGIVLPFPEPSCARID
uniref:Uncharacterized protein n=1 Tax=Aegilops tauschii subsp. strangulata TaxID=200361 RepID=A0A453DKD7_AEGTS